ncbi:MAG: xylulokinase [Candidatus Humimicrobiaceae bacterium]
MAKYLLGIDIGTSSCKVAVFDTDGQVICSENGTYKVYYPYEGWAEQNPVDWWDTICCSIRKIWESGKATPADIAGIGIDGQGWSAIAVDKSGEVLCNTPIWMDTRSADIAEELQNRIGEDKIFEVCGNPMQPAYTLPKILWYKRQMPQVYEKTSKILISNSYIGYKLTGEITQDVCQAYGYQCFDMRRGVWNKELCKEMGVNPDFLPEIYPCHHVIGKVTTQAARITGLLEGTPVIAGGLDAACGTLGAGVIGNGQAQEQGGQAGGMSVCLDKYSADVRLILSFHVVPDKWLIQGGTVGGGGVMKWFEQEFGGEERCLGDSFKLLDEKAAAVNAGSDGVVFLPYMSGERSPIWDRKAKGVYYGLDYAKTKGHFVRASLEGVAYSLRHNLEVAENAGAYVNELHATGGAANSLIWTQIKADVTGKTIKVPSSDTATTLGAAILAGVGVGLYSSFEEAVRKTVKVKREHIPNKDNFEVYDRQYKKYIKIYRQLKDIMDQ